MLCYVRNQWLAQPVQEGQLSGKAVRVARDQKGQSVGPRWVVKLYTGRVFIADREDYGATVPRNVGKYSPKAPESRL